MLVALAIANFQLRPAEYVVDKCSSSHRSLARATVGIKVVTVGATKTEKLNYHLSYDRGVGAYVRIDRLSPMILVVEPKRVVQYDVNSGQYTENPRQQSTVFAEIKAVGATSDEIVSNLLDPDGIERMLKSLRKRGLWMLEQHSGFISAVCVMPDGRMEISVDPSTHLLRHLAMKADKYGTDYWFSYGTAPTAIRFAPPSNAYLTTEIRPQISRPKPSNKQERGIVSRVFDRYDNPPRLWYSVSANNENVSVWIERGRIKQSDGKVTWAFEDGFLSLIDSANQTFVSGPAKLSDLIEVVAKCGSRAEPLLRLMLRGINPFRFYFSQSPDLVVSGSTTVDGNTCSIVEARGKQQTISLIVRDADGFVYSVMPLTSGKAGADLPSTPRTYKPLAAGPGSYRLMAPQGYQRKAVADLVGQPPPD